MQEVKLLDWTLPAGRVGADLWRTGIWPRSVQEHQLAFLRRSRTLHFGKNDTTSETFYAAIVLYVYVFKCHIAYSALKSSRPAGPHS